MHFLRKTKELTRVVFCWLFFSLVGLAPAKGQIFTDQLFYHTDKIEIPFELVNGFIVLDVAYGPRRLPLKFIFDTGAEYSILTYKEFARMSGARIGREVIILGADLSTKIRANVIHGNQLDIANRLNITNVDMILLGEDFLNIGQYVGFPVHGIIGANIFSRFLVEINYKKSLIVFHDPRKNKVSYKGYHEMNVDFISRKPYIQMLVEMPNGVPFTGKYLVDCGADLSLLMMLGSHEQLEIPKNTLVAHIAAGLGGSLKGYMGRVNRIELASLELSSPVIHYQEMADSTRLDASAKNGIVGNRILSMYNVLIDYPNRKLFLKPYRKKIRRMKVDKSGMSVIASGPFLNQLSIAHILEGTPAAKAGLQAGDIILKINGFPALFWDVSSVTNKLMKKEGRKIKVVILREGKRLKFSFRLKKYI